MSASLPIDADESTFDPHARLGECIADKWTLEEVLGRGGMAVVYGATHRNGHRTAIKMLLPSIARDESLVRRFLREGYLANKVPHEGAVRVLDDGRAADGSPYIVMERLDGYSLDAHLKSERPPLDTRGAVDVILELLDVLEAAHGAGIVHRDIKPANIFRTKQGALKLLDFGIAVLVDAGPRTGATQSGMVMGTPAFMAPEQARGRKELVGPRSDLWAVAASGLALMVGGPLRDATTAAEELAMAALQPLPPASTFGEALRGRLGDLLDRALSFEPRDRFGTAAEMREAFVLCRREGATVRVEAVAIPTRTLRMAPGTVAMPDSPQPPREAPARDASAAHPITPTSVSSPPPAMGAASTRGWLVAGLAVAAVAVVVLGLVVVQARRNQPLTATPAQTATATTPPAEVAAPGPSATILLPAPPMPSTEPSPSLPASASAMRTAPASTPATPTRPSVTTGRGATGATARPPPARPTNAPPPAGAKPDFMDER